MNGREAILARMRTDAEDNGYHLTPDHGMLDGLIDGLAANHVRYGYASCPCRISSGLRTYDSDIICPCEYRDADVNEFGMCYCCLFVSKEVSEDPSKMAPIVERRPVEVQDAAFEALERAESEEAEAAREEDEHGHVRVGTDAAGMPIWRCKVCGYLAARETPPPVCPICKAKADRFEKFGMGGPA